MDHPNHPDHLPSIDALRGVAILLVLVLHFNLAYSLGEGFADFLPPAVLRPLIGNGNYGVVIFFVISGFLITSRTLLRHPSPGRMGAARFYAARAGRILPNIALMLAIVVGLAELGVRIFANGSTPPSMALTVASILTFTHNVLMQKYGYFNYCLNTLWSLSVEEVFYLGFPIVCLTLRRPWPMAIAWSAFVIAGPIYRHFHRHDDTDIYGLYGYLACFDGISIGCIAALLRSRWRAPAPIRSLRYLCLSGMAAIYFADEIWSNVVWGITGMSLLTGLFALLASNASSPGLAHRFTWPLRKIGALSYELYLFHIVLLALLRTFVPKPQIAAAGKTFCFAAFVAVSTLVAAAISRFYAEPLNRSIRRRLNALIDYDPSNPIPALKVPTPRPPG